MKVDGRLVFWMLFAIAFGYSVNPAIGGLVLITVLAALNRERVIQTYRALDDAARRLEKRIEDWHQRRQQTPATPAKVSETAKCHNTPYINRTASVVTLPEASLFSPTAPRPSRLAVPLGRDQTGAFRWLDFEKDALHVGLYGTSGCGKDHLLRLWFAALLQEPQVKWAILDGKGDWLTPNIARLPQMLFPPAGGYGDEGQQRILDAVRLVNEEAKRRFGLLLEAGVRSVDEYNQTAQTPLPLLIVLTTDIIDVVDETERLLVALVSKARALGIRVIASMQTPTGKRMEWRMNLSTLISGALVDGSQDAPALGVRDPKALLYRPSQLPPPPGERGLFVVRHNNEQFVVRTPALRGDFDALVNARNDAALLETLLSAQLSASASEPSASASEPSASASASEPQKLPEMAVSPDADTDRIGALATLITAGVTREQARALGVRFDNSEWAAARRKAGK